MQLFEINFSQDDIDKLAEEFPTGFTEAALPELAQYVKGTAYKIKNTWINYLLKEESLPGVEFLEKTNKNMIESVKIKKNRDFNYTVFSDSVEMEKATKGTDPVYYDMKKTHPYGKKSRVSKKGVPYLIIPFRWGTPNGKDTKRRWNSFIPMAEYNTSVKKLEKSMRAPDGNGNYTHVEKNYKGEDIERSNYSWGDRLTGWNDRSAGMVRMKDSGKSTYWTFRIISANSKQGTWLYWKDGQKGVNFISALREVYAKKYKENFVTAMENDLSKLE